MNYRHLATAAVLLLLPSAAAAQERPVDGLVLPTSEQLAQVPDASLPFGGTLPPSMDLSAQFPPPGNQGNQNSCVGWAVAYALKTFQERAEESWPLTHGSGGIDPNRVFSPAYVYNQINGGQNRPTSFVDAFNLVLREGVAPLAAMPYDGDFQRQPSPAARQAAARFRIRDWQEVPRDDVVHTKAQLSQDRPVVIGMLVDPTFAQFRGNGIIRNYGSPNLSGHAMVVVGYDDARQAFRVLNSYGPEWGDGGYAWVSYEHYRRAVQGAFVLFDTPNGAAPAADPVRPASDWVPPVTAAETATLQIVNQIHNFQVDPYSPKLLRLEGVMNIPRGVTGRATIVLRLADANGQPLPAVDPRFALPNGQSAAISSEIVLNGEAVPNAGWWIGMPYCLMGAPSGVVCVGNPYGQLIRSRLTGIVTLFVNGQSVAESQPFPFEVLQ